jgi:DNA-binding LytR/AlgR family response regulator
MDALRIAVCEDREDDQKRLGEILRNIRKMEITASFFSSGEDLLRDFSPRSFDLILLDIYMTGMTGIETCAKIRDKDPDVPVAFITTSLEHALESYRLSAIGYIEKPCQQKDIEKLIQVVVRIRANRPSLVIQKRNEILRIPTADIEFLEQKLHQVMIVCSDGRTVSIYGKISELLPQLDADIFCQPLKSYCVNLEYVCSIDRNLRSFIMQNGTAIPIRREDFARIKRIYEQYIFRKAREL